MGTFNSVGRQSEPSLQAQKKVLGGSWLNLSCILNYGGEQQLSKTPRLFHSNEPQRPKTTKKLKLVLEIGVNFGPFQQFSQKGSSFQSQFRAKGVSLEPNSEPRNQISTLQVASYAKLRKNYQMWLFLAIFWPQFGQKSHFDRATRHESP